MLQSIEQRPGRAVPMQSNTSPNALHPDALPDALPDTDPEGPVADSLPADRCEVPVLRIGADGRRTEAHDQVAAECPVALEYNGISHAVMMASPGDLEDFALGFSLSEGIVQAPREVFDIEVQPRANGISVRIEIAAERFVQLKERRRNLVGRTGCGICGAETIEQALRPLTTVTQDMRMPAQYLHAGLIAMQRRQPLQQTTGATHACGWLNASGLLEEVREDVGRHNALDKLIGARARRHTLSGSAFADGAVLTTSRASVEMVQKAAGMGAAILVAISAPTALAIDIAERTGLTLVGFTRPAGSVCYSHPQRLT